MTFPVRRASALAFAAACLAGAAVANAPIEDAPAEAFRGRPLREGMPWYHSSEELERALDEFEGNCPNVTFSKESQSRQRRDGQGTVSLDVLRISRGKPGQAGKTKAMLVFGEHARELITVESGLELVKALCGAGANADSAARVIDKVDLTIVPNANPVGRRQVEQGASCKRTNEDGVDLNRNWSDEHRDDQDQLREDEMNPGPYAFSEPESQILRDVATRERPDVFLSVHSGAYLLGRPFGYSGQREVPNAADMDSILSTISERYCGGGCPFGGLAQDIGYKSKGCDIDYISEHVGTPYVFEWEIYVDPQTRRYYDEKARSHSGGTRLSENATAFFFSQSMNLVQVQGEQRRPRGQAGGAARTLLAAGSAARALRVGAPDVNRTPASARDERPSDCSEQFNPQSAEETRAVVDNWTGAYLELLELVSARKASGGAPAVAVPIRSAEDALRQHKADQVEDDASTSAVLERIDAFFSGDPQRASAARASSAHRRLLRRPQNSSAN